MPKRLDAATGIGIAIALLLWASAFAGIKAGLVGFGPGQVALLRFGTASVVLAVYALVTRMRLPDFADLPRIALAGILGITIYHIALNFGEVSVTAGAASLIIASGPIFTALMAVALLGERLTVWGWAGIVVAFSGVALITLGEGGGVTFQPDALLVLLAAISTAGYFVVSKPLLDKYDPIAFTSYTIWLGTLPMLAFLPGLVSQFPDAGAGPIISVIYLGVFPGAIAYALYSRALSKLPASIASSFLYVQPVNATIIAWIWIREVPGLMTLLGGAVALVGVTLVTMKGRHPVA